MSSSQSSATRVPIWDLLQNEHTEKEAPDNTESLLSLRAGEESVIGIDERVLVASRDFAPGGKYRSVVKLFLRFEAQEIDDPWALASGWLIRNNLVVTAGHCAFDHSHGLGRLTHVKAYIGYHGNESINDPSYAVQFRTAKQVVTTQNWLEDGSNEAFDVSFILLESPFDDITPIQYETTPQTGNSKLGIVGYPGDLMDKDTGEKGAFMWEMFQETSWNLATSSSHMLQYKIDTYGGNSGSAVFLQRPIAASDAISIGIHVYGGNPNSASVIGHLGNDFAIYLAALDAYTSGILPLGATKQTVANQPWLTYINIPARDHDGSWDPNGPSGGGDGTETEIGDGPGTLGGKITGVDEGFLDILNKAVKVVGPIASTALKVGLPLALGPVGAPISALAGVALNVAGKIAASATGTEADAGKSYTFNGVAERAVLGEAAIECLKHMGNAKCKSLGVFDSMDDTVKRTAPTLEAVAPKIMSAVAEPALRMTLDSLSRAQAGTEDTFITPPIRDPKRKETDTTGLAPRLSENQEAFIAALGASLTKEDTESFLGVLSSVGNVISQGLRVAAPIIGSVAQTGLSLLLQGTEAGEDVGPFSFEGLSERSLIGEAALTAIMNMPVKTVQEEGLFDIMKKVVTTIGPAVLKTAPSVISAVTPIVHSLLQGTSKGNEEVIINPNGDFLIDAAEIGVWSARAGYNPFRNWMHVLHPAGGAGQQALSVMLQNNLPTAQDFGRESLLFAMTEYADTISRAVGGPGPVFPWRNYIKFFGTLGAGGVPNAVTIPGLSAPYASLQNAAATAQLTNIQNAIMNLPIPQRPQQANAVWFWLFVLSAIEVGTVVCNGLNVVLTSHIPVIGVPTNFGIASAAPMTLTIHVADFISLISNMMVAFTTNVYPPHNALNQW